MAHQGLGKLARKLVKIYPVTGWWPAGSRFEIMAGAVLVQNTRWVNAQKALVSLKQADALNFEAIAAMGSGKLASLIHSAGCQSVKSPRLRALARWIQKEGGITPMARKATDTLRAGLLSVHGIGPETADAILCFAFRRPVFVADLYARRLFARYGLLEPMTY